MRRGTRMPKDITGGICVPPNWSLDNPPDPLALEGLGGNFMRVTPPGYVTTAVAYRFTEGFLGRGSHSDQNHVHIEGAKAALVLYIPRFGDGDGDRPPYMELYLDVSAVEDDDRATAFTALERFAREHLAKPSGATVPRLIDHDICEHRKLRTMPIKKVAEARISLNLVSFHPGQSVEEDTLNAGEGQMKIHLEELALQPIQNGSTGETLMQPVPLGAGVGKLGSFVIETEAQ
jgi:hypothetical protein